MINNQWCIHQIIQVWAEYTPTSIAVAAPDRVPLTYQKLHHHICDVRQMLNGLGIGRNDRVAAVIPGGPEAAIAFIAIASSATIAPLNPAYQSEEFDFYLSDLAPQALVLHSELDTPAIDKAHERGIPVIMLHPTVTAEAGLFTLQGEVPGDVVHDEPAQPGDVALMLHTSGTTSKPKLVPLTHKNLCCSAHNIQKTLELTSTDRCLNIMPLFHIHGLIAGVLSSLTAGASVVCTPGFYAPKVFEWMETFRPTWYTAVPTMHQAILARTASHQEIVAHHTLRFIRSCSSALPAQLLTALEGTFSVPVIEAYGMTEASHQIASNPLPPRKHKAGSVGMAVGAEVAIIDTDGTFLPPGKAGEIVIRGPNVTLGYTDNPTANDRAFMNGWFRTGDHGYIDDDEYIFITGRLKEIINRGGEKILPREVDEVLLCHPAVEQAVTFALPHETLGEDVAAAIVLRKNSRATESEIREFVSLRVAAFKIPQRIVFLDELPKGSTGKPQRIDLAQRLGFISSRKEQSERQKPFTEPTTLLETILAEIWSEVLHVEPVGIHDDFFELGGDSVLATQIMSRIYEILHIELSSATFFEGPTVATLALALIQDPARHDGDMELKHLLAELDAPSEEAT